AADVLSKSRRENCVLIMSRFYHSYLLGPTKRAAHGFLPPDVALVALIGGHLGFEFAVEGPVAGDVIEVFPVADGKARQIGRAEGGSLGDDGPADGGVQDVSLKLHQSIVHRGAAIDL